MTDPDHYARLERLLQSALAIPEPERYAYLDEACGDDAQLREEIDALLVLQADDLADPFSDQAIDESRRQLEGIVQDAGSSETAEAADSAGAGGTGSSGGPEGGSSFESIGPYRILELLGEGGMGLVYLAEQREPVQRRVALKLIKGGMDSDSIVSRFELERRSLALMDHPAIARVYDCGASERGEPYVAMEVVDGEPLPDFCDREELSLADRIDVFRQLCAGVQHAHTKGIVHRDLKPANVLGSMVDGRPRIKIIDFGVARAIEASQGEPVLRTAAGVMIGTPEYMSPEQAAGASHRIDTRTDVYALGVMLYEILCGALPFSSEELRSSGMVEACRRIQEDEPARPSSRTTKLRDTADDRARKRKTTVQKLQRELEGDLDWIVLRAMAKEPDRRYDSAQGLGDDLLRYLRHEPVTAGPPSARYRIRKFVRRYRVGVGAAAVVLVAVLVGVIGTAFGFARASREARTNAAIAEQKARLAEDLTATTDEFDMLAGGALRDRLVDGEKVLYPAWPHQIEALERWLDDCDQLLALRKQIEETLDRLRTRALPLTDALKEHDLTSHPRYAEWIAEGKMLASGQRSHAIYTGQSTLPEVEIPESWQDLDYETLTEMAKARVIDDTSNREARFVFDEEALGLAAARLAVEKAGRNRNAYMLNVLSAALLANGQYDEAVRRADQAFKAASRQNKARYASYRRGTANRVKYAEKGLEKWQQSYDSLTAEVTRRRAWNFPPGEGASQFLHDTLADLVDELEQLESAQRPEIQARLDWARRIESLTRAHPNARVTWDEVRNDIATNPRYAGSTLHLHEADLLGLVPLGANPATGYHEFYHLRSACPHSDDPAEVAIPEHNADGSIDVTEGTGIVFVLLPGGTFTMGAQSTDPEGPNYEPTAEPIESPVHDVTLDPFLIARHELTQAQWKRLWTGDPSLRQPCSYKAGTPIAFGGMITWMNPVASVDKRLGDQLLIRYGLTLPTEAQWEYGCRAGTTTPWSVALDALSSTANLADASYARFYKDSAREEWTDGYLWTSPVGSFAPNAFGMYDVHGNVAEWVKDDGMADYSVAPRAGDGLRSGSLDRARARGGGVTQLAHAARSSARNPMQGSLRLDFVGLRPARSLQSVSDVVEDDQR